MIPLSDNIPSRTTPYVTIGIIIACVATFVLEWVNPDLIGRWAFRPAYVASLEAFQVGPVHVLGALIASIFLHGGLLHIASNMLFLWVFGDNVEDRMGHLKFLAFYLLCGVVATLVHSFSAVLGLVHDPQALQHGVVGASGAIAGILGAYLVLVPRSMIRTVVFFIFILTVIPIPAPFFIVFWFILQLFNGVGSLAVGAAGIAYWAHIGGFAVGYLIARRSLRRRRVPPAQGPRIIEINVEDL